MSSRPTLQALAACVVVFLLQQAGGAVGLGDAVFALALPLSSQPWTLVVSVYAHGGLTHLLANAVALVLIGPLVARVTTPARFHAFFIITGALAGIAQVLVLMPFGGGAVLGASGAIFALFGYLLVGNRGTGRLLSVVALGTRGKLVVLAVLAALLTAATATPGAALVAHFVGFVLGAAAGGSRLLHTSGSAG
ncbi:probable rhomboid family protease [Natronomonas pharaonis DSM 2160]|uniref:Probable rhomboid family protease n=1 Tax=Natronomonas pharaonis (strain ATCC 35678 / DSM 2160 / CIP 103997 / JCM 8858 / NBRC 14720 / NCIMB 2260 / Gabara) TaxID=348780 RepID=A0A1U7EXP7_NATPD|nr:rhomboid family intramembrane serine protease [Natronomonas pharaonis]CAI49953.1 probable rhomboid family protease [Natronomonas pharaonis DSM 2160]